MPSLLASVRSQPTAVHSLRRALSTGRVHHAYLFDGPAGVGKELTAFGLAQALLCEKRAPNGDDACGVCSACVRTIVNPETRLPKHPDIVVLERGLYEPAQLGRRTPETQDLSIDQVRVLVLAHAAYAPHEGRARVFIVRRAEELSTSAANALLKTLEEPIDRTYFVLLTSQPDVLLPTVRSRTQRIRFGPLPEDLICELLVAHGVLPESAQSVATLSEGSAELAQILADTEASSARNAFVSRLMESLGAPTLGQALDLAEQSKRDKVALRSHLAALASHVAERAKTALTTDPPLADRMARNHEHIVHALLELDRNASPQLVLESMAIRMRP